VQASGFNSGKCIQSEIAVVLGSYGIICAIVRPADFTWFAIEFC